eukprot:jgi/Tetstr1/458015/TSEL_044524.t1
MEVDRQHEHGYVEGPLQYVPWLISAIACIIKHDPYKMMFYSVLLVLEDYGFPVKNVKTEWPNTRMEYTGVLIDSARGEVSVTASRAAKWAAAVQPVYTGALAEGRTVPRGRLASVIGKLQWCCAVLPRGQAYLMELYAARDTLLTGPTSSLTDE